MHNNKIKFRIGEISLEATNCKTSVVKTAQKLSNLLANLKYYGTLREKNTKQLDIHFEEALLNELKIQKWSFSVTPHVNMSALEEDWGKQEADFIMSPRDIKRNGVVLEVEKANKKTLWFDFIKLWMFIETKQADSGILLCTKNYSHRLGVWNLFDEACSYKRYLERFAGVPKEKLSLIAIIGYKQMINTREGYKVWNKDQFNILKKTA